MPKISVLIPAYNAQETIQKTMNSVLNQTFTDFELIIVNDGSKDATEEIVLSNKDERIRYFKKENGGIANTRNYAISVAQGEYIAFLDADDWMEENALELLVNKANETKAEVVVCDYRYVYEDGMKQDIRSNDFGICNLDTRKTLLLEVMPQPWNKLVKKEVFMRSELCFPDGLVFEDLCYYSCLMPSINSIAKLNEVLVNYYQLGTSIMASARKIKNTIYDFDQVIQRINNYYTNNNLLMRYKSELEGLFALNARELIDSIFKNKAASVEEKEKVIKSILNTINQKYPKWYKNNYYTEKYRCFGKSYLLKRRIIDALLAKGQTSFVLKKIVKV